jgi:hypothetical protein
MSAAAAETNTTTMAATPLEFLKKHGNCTFFLRALQHSSCSSAQACMNSSLALATGASTVLVPDDRVSPLSAGRLGRSPHAGPQLPSSASQLLQLPPPAC